MNEERYILDMMITNEMQQQYLHRRRADLYILRKALLEKGEDSFKTIGHQIKGNASSFGYCDLTEVAERIETIGNSRNWSLAEDVIADFEFWLNRTEEAHNKNQEKG